MWSENYSILYLLENFDCPLELSFINLVMIEILGDTKEDNVDYTINSKNIDKILKEYNKEEYVFIPNLVLSTAKKSNFHVKIGFATVWVSLFGYIGLSTGIEIEIKITPEAKTYISWIDKKELLKDINDKITELKQGE